MQIQVSTLFTAFKHHGGLGYGTEKNPFRFGAKPLAFAD